MSDDRAIEALADYRMRSWDHTTLAEAEAARPRILEEERHRVEALASAGLQITDQRQVEYALRAARSIHGVRSNAMVDLIAAVERIAGEGRASSPASVDPGGEDT